MLRPLKALVATTQPLNQISEIVILQNCGSGEYPYSYRLELCNYSIMYLESAVMERKHTLEGCNSKG